VFCDWGFQNRTTAVRVSAPGRFEFRSADSTVNPYLSMAALLVCMRDGLDNNLDPGQPEERNIYEAIAGGKKVHRIPATLGEALEALEADDLVKTALPGDMYRVFKHYKDDEWIRFISTVSDWDIKEYLDVLP
jgi:glutamine synthetase